MLGSQPGSPIFTLWWKSNLSHAGAVGLLYSDVEAVVAFVTAVVTLGPHGNKQPARLKPVTNYVETRMLQNRSKGYDVLLVKRIALPMVNGPCWVASSYHHY